MITQIRWDRPNDYRILCSDKITNNQSYAPLGGRTCKRGALYKLKETPGFSRDKKDAQGVIEKESDGTNKKELIPCDWK